MINTKSTILIIVMLIGIVNLFCMGGVLAMVFLIITSPVTWESVLYGLFGLVLSALGVVASRYGKKHLVLLWD